MNDLYLRQQLNALTGQTVFKQETGNATAIPGTNAWTSIDVSNIAALGVAATTPSHISIKALKLTTTVPSMEYRITVDGVKTWPFSDSTELLSGVHVQLDDNIRIPEGKDINIEVRSSSAGSVTLDYLSIIQVKNYDFD